MLPVDIEMLGKNQTRKICQQYRKKEVAIETERWRKCSKPHHKILTNIKGLIYDKSLLRTSLS